ncbi:phosphoglycolate phosphatase [Rhodobacteraceae bacterium D3-12]|nr:phosphoglycolate phosphatase [Rhodobacteraceae bacterium D3-12]
MSAVVFDLDGTLIDSAPDIHAATNRMLVGAGAEPLTLSTVISFVGNGLPTLVARAMDARGIDMARHDELSRITLGYYEEASTALTRVYPGVFDALDRLQAEGHALGICTNKPETAARQVLDELNLARYFPAVLGGDSLSVKKPDPEPLRAVFAAMGAHSGLFVGDSEVDAATAAAAQVPFALFTLGYRKAEVEDLPHQFVFSEFAELPGIVARAG